MNTNFENKMNELLNSEELNKRNNYYYQQSQNYLGEYNQILNEPEMKTILENFNLLKSKYNFSCELLLDGLYSNQKYMLFESHVMGPFTVDVINPQYSFLTNKVFNTEDEIKREILKQTIRILSNNDPTNFAVINNSQAIFKCVNCQSFCKNSNNDYQFFDNKQFDNIGDFNCFVIGYGGYYYSCRNCKKSLISKEDFELLDKLTKTSVSVKHMDITSSDGGSISAVTTEARIRKVN